MDQPHHHRRLDASIIFVVLLGVTAGTILLAAFQFMLVVWCNDNHYPMRRRPPGVRRNVRTNSDTENTPSGILNSRSNAGVELIPVYGYSKEFEEGMCAVCLSEFKEGVKVRVLPECGHLFHVPCIDMWLYSHQNCPLCRADTTPSLQHVVVALPDTSGGGVSPPPSPVLYGVPELVAIDNIF